MDTRFLTSALVGGAWSASIPCRFSPGEISPSTYLIEGRVGQKAGLNDMEKRKFFTLLALELMYSAFIKGSRIDKIIGVPHIVEIQCWYMAVLTNIK
jgi:hypothetical protein